MRKYVLLCCFLVRIKKNAGESGKVSASTTSTQGVPTFSRETLGAAFVKRTKAELPISGSAASDALGNSTSIYGAKVLKENVITKINAYNSAIVCKKVRTCQTEIAKKSPDDMETINMWAEMSSRVADARSNKRPLQSTSKSTNSTTDNNAQAPNVATVITSFDVSKIRKDAETAIRNDEKMQIKNKKSAFVSEKTGNLQNDGGN